MIDRRMGIARRGEDWQSIKSWEGAKSIGVGAATISSAGDAVGIGNVFSSLIHSVARNPSLTKQLFGYAILGFALTEAISLFALMMAFFILFFSKFILFKGVVLEDEAPNNEGERRVVSFVNVDDVGTDSLTVQLFEGQLPLLMQAEATTYKPQAAKARDMHQRKDYNPGGDSP
ncbi:unnamed protein product [Vicia faba]|uniref:ATP synthase subunit 9, mitochondrial n=1 Tax=Vicia faba TaxID=3906 RepID=A0AAV0ZW30_VICFA|nr:unnamed protein product [Vicia faba]